MKVAIIKYNAGNVRSVAGALRRLGADPLLTDDPTELLSADRVIFPGVGQACAAMDYLRERGMDRLIRSLTQPVLGICLGMQLMCTRSEEGNIECLGIFPETVTRFHPKERAEKVPHVGWNTLSHDGTGLFQGLPDREFVYFVHGYYVPVCPRTTAQTDYIQPFSAALRGGNFLATQFHPEKSGAAGERILKNFLEMRI